MKLTTHWYELLDSLVTLSFRIAFHYSRWWSGRSHKFFFYSPIERNIVVIVQSYAVLRRDRRGWGWGMQNVYESTLHISCRFCEWTTLILRRECLCISYHIAMIAWYDSGSIEFNWHFRICVTVVFFALDRIDFCFRKLIAFSLSVMTTVVE